MTRTLRLRIAALAALGATTVVAALPAVLSSPIIAGWIWVR